MRTRLTATIALAAMIFSALLVIGSPNAGAQDSLDLDLDLTEELEKEQEREQEEDDGYERERKKKDRSKETVQVCKLTGLDWTLYEMDLDTAEYWLANGAQPAGDGGCLVRLCQEKTGDYFTYWSTRYLSKADAAWLLEQQKAYVADKGVACPANEPVSICIHADDGDYVKAVKADAADWMLFTGQASLLVDGKCKLPEPEPTPEPTPEPEDKTEPTPEPTPETEDKTEPTPEPEEEPEEEASAPTPEVKDDPKVDAEVKGAQEVRELAFTGTESSDLALYGGLILATGLGLVTISRRRLAAEV